MNNCTYDRTLSKAAASGDNTHQSNTPKLTDTSVSHGRQIQVMDLGDMSVYAPSTDCESEFDERYPDFKEVFPRTYNLMRKCTWYHSVLAVTAIDRQCIAIQVCELPKEDREEVVQATERLLRDVKVQSGFDVANIIRKVCHHFSRGCRVSAVESSITVLIGETTCLEDIAERISDTKRVSWDKDLNQ